MKVDEALIDRLAELSRLTFSDAEKREIAGDLEKILSFMEKLNQVDTEDVEALVYVGERTNIFREDVVKDNLPKTDVLKNAPLKDPDYFKVPKVISQPE